MYWLRRIPAETRIVVLVVFLALIQSILLSVFGLRAIRGERSTIEEQMRLSARHFLQQYVVRRCQNGLRDHAAEVFRAAFDDRDDSWAQRPLMPGRGLFTHAFEVDGTGTIRTPAGLPLLVPRAQADGDSILARAEARKLAGPGDWDEAEKAQLDLEFAERHPFARDEFGDSLALLFAATPLLAGEGTADAATLLRIRRVGVLNRVAGYVSGPEVARFLARVDEAGSGNAAFADGCARQDRLERVVAALHRERPSLPPPGDPVLHRNVLAPSGQPFYVRHVAGEKAMQVLAVDRARLHEFLEGVVAKARADRPDGFRGIEPRIEEAGAASFDGEPARDIEGMPGYAAVARLSADTLKVRTGDRERFYWLIIVFSVAGILAGGLLTARAVMREVKLAKLKSGFVSNVSHELKTPLTSIRMFSEMLRSGKVTDDAERAECLDVIAQEAQRLGKLIQRVLDFGRLEAQQRRFRWIVGSLQPVVERETQRFRRATGMGEEEFTVRIAVNLPPVTFDPDAFSEVVANLLSNAYKYAPAEGRRIRLEIGPRHGRVVMTVDDNGPGVRPRERRRIFEQFYRAGDLLARDVEGSGLGLAIARGIVRAHGGRIQVEDGPLGGSRFVVTLPAARTRGRVVPAAGPAEKTS